MTTVEDSGGQASAVADMFEMVDENVSGELQAHEVQAAHEMIRMGGISLNQVRCCYYYYLLLFKTYCGTWCIYKLRYQHICFILQTYAFIFYDISRLKLPCSTRV